MLKRALRRSASLLWWWVWRGVFLFVVISLSLVMLFRVVPPPGSMVMVERKIQSWVHSEPIQLQREWRSWSQLADSAKVAVMAAEDQRFPHHHGFDITELRRALQVSMEGGRLRGQVHSVSKPPKMSFYGPAGAGCVKGWKLGLPCSSS